MSENLEYDYYPTLDENGNVVDENLVKECLDFSGVIPLTKDGYSIEPIIYKHKKTNKFYKISEYYRVYVDEEGNVSKKFKERDVGMFEVIELFPTESVWVEMRKINEES